MDKINIDGVTLTPLKRIYHSKGDILHGMKKGDNGYVGFGEAYFSMIKYDEIKGWNRHKEMTLNLVVPIGSISFVIYDDRGKNNSDGTFLNVELSPSSYARLTVPPGLWLAFKGKDAETSLILNIASLAHSPDEVEKLDLKKIPYNWESI